MVREQIAALRQQASLRANGNQEIGRILSANMAAAFALELGLKVFYMTFEEEGPPRTHELKLLFLGLPAPIVVDITCGYAAVVPRLQSAKVLALTVSPEMPSLPNGACGGGWGAAPDFFETASRAFVEARYFYEKVTDAGWATVTDLSPVMVEMSQVLDRVYDGYLSKGGWA
jgi:hypothetical protein